MTCAVALRGAFLADDVRTESNGKLIVIGAYGSSILVSGFPFTAGLWVVALVNFFGVDTCKLELRGVMPTGDVTFQVGGEIAGQQADVMALVPIGPIPMHFSQGTEFSIEARINDRDWNSLGRWAVTKTDVETRTA